MVIIGDNSAMMVCTGVCLAVRTEIKSSVGEFTTLSQRTNDGRKRRSSADDGVMDDCMAAMVLMSLSCSPKSPCLPINGESLRPSIHALMDLLILSIINSSQNEI
ncbi:hypothetical protein AVEN_136187-1 [Araneus ventricosus]|uniref:Uncharacterized protein n=1 Tax=Araneus ventricosus TaxID=182803 RepID=A0A4Y2RBR2_ARAVE|nr:hypothetical protein AVEN_136187-1 [Araneus ventricosus]